MRITTDTTALHQGIALAGRFDAHEVSGFRTNVESLLSDSTQTLRLDLSNVVFVDSSALAELVHTQRTLASRGGRLVLVDPSDPVRIILELTALAQVFTIENGKPAAVPAP